MSFRKSGSDGSRRSITMSETVLISGEKPQYKANLHCHTTVSDGRNTPEEMKEYYKARGYQIMAMTDHELLVDHTDLNDADFLCINGYEYAFAEGGVTGLTDLSKYRKALTMEFNLYAKDPGNTMQVCFNPEWVIHGEMWRIPDVKAYERGLPRDYTAECMQKLIDKAAEHGFLVNLNHPNYSYESPEFFGDFRGLMSMEIINQGCYYKYGEYNGQMYDSMLKRGQRIGILASDDNHRAIIDGDEADPRPWGCTMIQPESFTYEGVIGALEKGNYYASQAPVIESLVISGGKVKIRSKNAKYFVMLTEYRSPKALAAPLHETLSEAVFDIPDEERYLRFEVFDAYGRRAATRAYFRDEWNY